jgi:hypothetical protein
MSKTEALLDRMEAELSLFGGFMHLPKTGGNSVFHIIIKHFPALRVCPSPRLGVWSHRIDDPRSYDFYSGHFTYELFEHLGKDAIKLVVLRHPVARMVSLYDFWRGFRDLEIAEITREIPDNGPLFASTVGFDEFISSPTPFVRTHVENGLSRQLLGRDYDRLASKPEAMIEEAYRRLMTFNWIGITEHFVDSIRRLAKLLRFDLIYEIPRMNSSYLASERRRPIERTVPTEQGIALVEFCNFADIELYNRIRNTFLMS